MKSLLPVVLVALCTPAAAQELQLKEILGGSVAPVILNLKDLGPEWRKIEVANGGDSSGVGALSALYGLPGGGGTFYTLGRTVEANGQTYLIAYRAARKPFDPQRLFRSGPEGAPKPEPLKPDTKLWLNLLNLRTSGSITDIQSFDLAEETKGPEEDPKDVKATNAASTSNLKQIALAVMMYCQDYDETMPPLKDPLKAKKVLMPYIKNESVFKNPGGWTYLPNPNLSGYRLAKVSSPANMPLYFEAAPAKDFTRAVAFCDGHVKRIGEAEWQKLKRAYKIRIGV